MTNFFRAARSIRQAGLLKCNRGATAIEYGLILAMVTLAVIGSLSLTAEKTVNKWSNISNAVNND